MTKTHKLRAFLWSIGAREWIERVRHALEYLTAEDDAVLSPDRRCRCGGRGTWTLNARFLDGSPGIEIVEFLTDHGVPFEEARACGLREIVIHCSQADAMRLADALQLLGTQALFVGEGSCLLTIRPGGK
ncbi:MAG: hypothetical protein ACSLFQ_02080 [Thermoanaerobaculia bacterium]